MERGYYYPPGGSFEKGGARFVIDASDIDCDPAPSLVLWNNTKVLCEVPLPENSRNGNVYSFRIPTEKLPGGIVGYSVRSEGEPVRDRFVTSIVNWKSYGVEKPAPIAGIVSSDYDWEGDKRPCTPFEDSVIYCLNVRSYTRHSSSKVSKKGTFFGLTQKLPHLKELGITAVELMPCYEFDENIKGGGVNLWGFTGDAYYFSPKSAYASAEPVTEFRDMVKAFHREGIELIMQFYFDGGRSLGIIQDVLRFWAAEYHIDGFRLLGFDLPCRSLLSDPYLADVKLIFPDEYTPCLEEHYTLMGTRCQDTYRPDCFKAPPKRRCALISSGFSADVRRLLKGDEDMLRGLIYHLKANDLNYGIINGITSYDGFTLRDLVSYNHKHNEANGEDGRDGVDDNYSWNCGEEGASRKKAINALRLRQMKNALFILCTAQGIPYIRGGDEFGFSQKGNNNPYNQDNDTSYINWKSLDSGRELYDFVRELLRIRREHRIFGRRELLMDMDYRSLGAPDISYHGEELWKINLTGHYRNIGIWYNGAYITDSSGNTDSCFYSMINLHWLSRDFALPRLEEGYRWELCVDTGGALDPAVGSIDSAKLPDADADMGIAEPDGSDAEPQNARDVRTVKVSVPPRTIRLYRSVEDGSAPAAKKGRPRGRRRSIPDDVTGF